MLLHYDRIIRAHVAQVIIDDLRMAFTYKNVADQHEQESSVTIYNLEEATYKQIYRLRNTPPYSIVRLQAGYRQHTGLNEVFSGTIAWIERDAKDGSIMTTLHIGDRIKQYSPTWFEKAYKEETTVRTVVSDIASNMGVKVLNMNVIPETLGVKDMHFSDASPNALRNVLTSIRQDVPNLYWVQDKTMIILSKGADPREDVTVLVKTPETGLIGVPKLEEDGRLKVDMLLDTRPQLKGAIQFQGSKYIDETVEYTIDKVTHKGDNWTGDFMTRLECIPPNYVPLSASGRVSVTAQGLAGGSRTGGDSDRNQSR